MLKISNFVIKYAVYGLVFLLPIFWLPWTVEVFEFNKQYLLFFLASLAFLAWMAKMVAVRKKFVVRRTPLDIWILVFLSVMILSSVFSVDKVSSWLGQYGRFTDSVIGTISMVVLYFVLINNVVVRKEKSAKKPKWGISFAAIANLVVASGWLIVVAAFLSVFNFWSKFDSLPQIMSFRTFSPMTASFEALSIYLAALVSLLVGVILTSSGAKSIDGEAAKPKNKKGLLSLVKKTSFMSGARVVLLVLSFVLLIIINFWPAWLALMIAMLFLLIMAFWTRIFKKRVNILAIPIIMFLVSVIYMFNLPAKIDILNSGAIGNDLPQELILSHKATRDISWQAIRDYPIFGSGTGTFVNDFTKYKPAEINETNFWNVRFDKGSSQILEMVATTGALGAISYLIVICIFLLVVSTALQKLRKEVKEQTNKVKTANIVIPFVLTWVALLIGQIFYLGNTTLLVYFWIFTALGIVGWQQLHDKKAKKINFTFEKLPEVGLVLNVVLLILVFVIAGMYYLGVQFYLADNNFIQPVENNQDLVQRMEKTVNLNRYRDNYRRVLSQAYLAAAWEEANKPEEERNVQLLQALASGSIQQARISTVLSPNSVSAWENLGAIYRDSRGLVGGTIPFALDTYARASELEPVNPIYYRERCRLNLINEDRDWDETINLCRQAVDLKRNYLDAQLQLALVYEQKGDVEDAISEMEAILKKLQGVSFERGSDLASAATEIYFQLGRLYFNADRPKNAVNMFEQAVIITPQYANARYALGLAYEADNRASDALIQYQILEQMMPDDETVKSLVQRLGGVSGGQKTGEDIVEEEVNVEDQVDVEELNQAGPGAETAPAGE